MLNLAVFLENSARDIPEHPAVIFGDRQFTYAEIDAVASRIGSALVKEGIAPGDRVALSCLNLPYFPIVYYAILKAGAVVVPLNVLLKRDEVAYHLRDSGAKAYFCFEGTPELPLGEEGLAGFQDTPGCEKMWVISADPGQAECMGQPTLLPLIGAGDPEFRAVPTAPGDTAVILYTSGTTGQPKGAELTHSNIVMNCMVMKDIGDMRPEDVVMIVLPLFHSFGQTCQMNAGFCMGNTLVLMPRFDPGPVLEAMLEHKVSVFAGVPTMYWGLLEHKGPEMERAGEIAETLRLGMSGGSAMPVEIMNNFDERFKVKILEGYGLSETSPVATFSRPDRPRKPGSVGLPIWGVEVGIVNPEGEFLKTGEEGEIVIKGHNIMKGYYNRPEATANAINKDGWFHSGDVGRLDEDGYLTIVDRVKDMIIRGGYNVYPRELEELIVTHPEVSLVAVVGVPDNKLGEEVKAYVIPADGATLQEDELVAWCRERMAAYKYPRQVEFRKELPMTATGKILKRELR